MGSPAPATTRLAIAATLVLLALGQPAHAQRAVILGAVTDTGLRALPAVNVQVIGTTAQLTTGDDGRFRIQEVSPGEYLVWVRRLGYRPVSNLVRVEAGDTLRLSYTLEPTTTELNTVTVTERNRSVKMKGFDERRAAGFGAFLDQAQIEKLNFVEAEGLIRTFPTVRVVAGMAQSRRTSVVVSCPLEIYIDGIPVGSNVSALPSPKEIAGIEVYGGPATTPIWLAQGGANGRDPSRKSCGVILIWKRDGS